MSEVINEFRLDDESDAQQGAASWNVDTKVRRRPGVSIDPSLVREHVILRLRTVVSQRRPSQFTTGARFGDFVFPARSSHPGVLLEDLYDMEEQEGSSAAIRLLYSRVNELLNVRDYDSVDRLLRLVDLAALRPETWVALLTITLPARSKLPARPQVSQAIRRRLRGQGQDADRILHGLI